MLYPLFVHVVFHVVEPILPIFLPLIDYNSKIGYTMTTCYQIYLMFFAVSGLSFCDAVFTNLVYNLKTLSGLLSNQMSALDEKVVKNSLTQLEVKQRLRNIFIMHFEVGKSVSIDESFLMMFIGYCFTYF